MPLHLVYEPGDTYDPIVAGSIDGTDTKPHDNGIVRALYANCKKFLFF